jgi:hypothetical protein
MLDSGGYQENRYGHEKNTDVFIVRWTEVVLLQRYICIHGDNIAMHVCYQRIPETLWFKKAP